MDKAEIHQLAKKIWSYHHMNHKLEKADCILTLGSNDIRVAERTVELFVEGWAPLIVFSGGRGRLTPHDWKSSEADEFAKRAIEMGISKEKILIESRSTNTGENILFTKELLSEHHINLKKIILVQKPYMERRAYATFKKLLPEIEVIVTSPQISFENYPNKQLSENLIINIMVGDLQRIKLYSEKGFQISQDIPVGVWGAYEKLVEVGYNKHLVK